jgi:hypothetical protein
MIKPEFMKRIVIVCIVPVLFCFSLSVHAQKEVNTGLVSGLIRIKYQSEDFLLQTLSAASPQQSFQAVRDYNTTRALTDQILYQLMADMRAKNSVRIFRKLNRYYKAHALSEPSEKKNNIAGYTRAIAEAWASCRDQAYSVPKGTLPVENLLSQGWTILKDLSAMRTERVNGVVEILNSARLVSPSEVKKAGNL